MSKKYEKPRPAMPNELKRQALIESGHRCAITRCSEHVRLEIHHIDGDRENNVLPNLIALCPIHHNDAEEDIIDRESLRQYKEINRSLQRLEQQHRSLIPTEVTFVHANRTVKKLITQLAPGGDKISASTIIELVKRTIKYGREFYNRGEVVNCAKLYQSAIVELLNKIDTNLEDYPEETANYINLILAELRPEVREVSTIDPSNADDIAWATRRAFDNILVISSLDEGIRDITELSKQAFIGDKVTMYMMSDIAGSVDIRIRKMVDQGAVSAAAQLTLVTARTMLGLATLMDKSDYSTPCRWLSTKLKPAVEELGKIDKSNAQHTFEKLTLLLNDFFDKYCMYD